MNKHKGVITAVVIVAGVYVVLLALGKASPPKKPAVTQGGAYKLRNMGPERFMAPVGMVGGQNVKPEVRKINDGAYAPVYPLSRAFSAPGF